MQLWHAGGTNPYATPRKDTPMTAAAEAHTTTDLNRVLPVFTYGTLRVGEGNWSWALRGKTISNEVATLTGARMFDNVGFPYVTMTDSVESDIVVGDLFYIRDDLYTQVVADLDGLEGFRGEGLTSNLYDRKIVTITTATGEQVEAYTYLVGADMYERRVRDYPVIVGGNWLERLAQSRY